MVFKSLIIGLILVSVVMAKPIDPNKIVIALNCGSNSEQVQAAQAAFKYVPDQSFVKGSSVGVDYHNDAAATESDIKFALDKQLYMYERHTYQQMTYELPVKKGKNTIIMKFAEMYFKSKGQRVFNIKIGQTNVVQNFDVIENAGSKYAAHEQFIEVDVKVDGVYFKGARINQGMENNKLKLSFAKGRADNPIVQAIIVYHDSIENSPRQQFQQLKSKWSTQQQMLKAKKQQKQIREMILIQKKKQKILIRNDQLVQEETNASKSEGQKTEKFGTIRSLLMGPLGIVMWTVAFGYIAKYCYAAVFAMQVASKIKAE